MVLYLLYTLRTFAQVPSRASQACPATLGVYPAEPGQTDLKLQQRARFEIRVCENNYPVRLLGFRKHERRPYLVVDTHASLDSLGMLIYRGSIVVLQVSTGSGSPVYIARFQVDARVRSLN